MRFSIILLSCFCLYARALAYVNINVYGTGLYLPYSAGVIGYIKKHIPIKEYKITGISGGAWCSLLYTQEDDISNHDILWDYAIGKNVSRISLYNDMIMFQKNIETNMKNKYARVPPKNLDKITIVSTNVNKFYNFHNYKMSAFENTNDLIDSCLCSSYIPYLSGKSFSKKYKGNSHIDGELYNSYKYKEHNIDIPGNTISIHRNMWGRKFEKSNYLYLDKEKSRELFEYGWKDTDINRLKLEKKLSQK